MSSTSQNPIMPAASAAPAKSAPAKKVTKKESAPAAPVVEAAPVAAAPAPKRAKKEVAAASVPVATPVAPAVTAQAVAPEAAPVEEVSWLVELQTLQAELSKIRDAVVTAIAASKRLEKRVGREMRDARKNRRRARAPPAEGEERKPSIFQVPVPISDELSVFLGGGKGNKMSRSAVTKAVSAYIKENKLNDKHKINPNAALRKLLGVKEGDELTIFNMQSYLQKHYIKPATA